MDGFEVFLLVALVVVAAAVSGWWWLIVRSLWRARVRGQASPLVALLALQLSIGLALASPMLGLGNGALALLLPPMQIIAILTPSPKVAAVMAQSREAIAWGTSAGLALAGVAALVNLRLLRWCLVPAMLLAALVILPLAERRSEQRMTTRAVELGADCLARRTFTESLRFWGEDFQFDLHASALIGGAWHGWSYQSDDFYLIPARAPKDGSGLQAACREQIEEPVTPF